MIAPMRPLKHPKADELILERVLYALSDPVRMDIVRRLASVSTASCGDLDGGRPKSTVSHHFRVLRESGLVETECAGATHMNKLRRVELDGRFPGLIDAILGQRSAEK
jgi:DNA-binding transcriptional ArsR family regulator